jgi:hypothetical protein
MLVNRAPVTGSNSATTRTRPEGFTVMWASLSGCADSGSLGAGRSRSIRYRISRPNLRNVIEGSSGAQPVNVFSANSRSSTVAHAGSFRMVCVITAI